MSCLSQGGTPEDCSRKFGVRLELTQFLAQTDLIRHGPIKLLFQDNKGAAIDIVALHVNGDLVVFGQDPVPGAPVGPSIILRVTDIDRPLRRFPQFGDSGLEVLELQQALTDRGFPAATDGKWGDETAKALDDFGRSQGFLVFIHPPGTARLIEKVWPALHLPVDQNGVPGLLDTR